MTRPPQFGARQLVLANPRGHRFFCCDDWLDAEFLFSFDPVFDCVPRLSAALNVNLVSSFSNVFLGYFFVFDHGTSSVVIMSKLLGCC
jgi:hypothetical protein